MPLEARKKLSEAKKGRKQSPETVKKRMKRTMDDTIVLSWK